MSKKNILIVIILIAAIGIGYGIYHYLGQRPKTINVYFNNTTLNTNTEDCSKVYPLNRVVPNTPELAKAALQELFKGPTDAENSQGYISWFSQRTKDILKSLKVENSTAYVDLMDIRRIIPNVSASCGSAQFLAEVETTLKQFHGVKKVIIAIDGKPSNFYEWVQIGCTEENNFCDETPFGTPKIITKEEEAQKNIEYRAEETILAIKNKDAEKLSNIIHPDKGVRFSPYSHINTDSDIIFSASQFLNFFQNNKIYLWGAYDGSGLPINLTPAEYYNKFIYDVDFAAAPEIGYNQTISKGNIINNIFEAYPGATIVEYYFSGFDPKYEGMDWRSLDLVFENGYLVGVVHGQWMI